MAYDDPEEPIAGAEQSAEQNVEQIFLARKLREARQVEELLNDAGIEYDVEIEPYSRSLLFGTIRYGAAFYVASAAAAACRQRLRDAGFARGVVEERL